MSPQNTFLLLPREIRDRIYIYALRNLDRVPPPTPDQAGNRSRNPFENYCPSFLAYEPNILPKIVPSFGLLGCCHQIRSEVQELIVLEDKNVRKRPFFQLDCLLERYRILPTWIAIPTSLVNVYRLEVNIRLLHMSPDDSQGRQQYVIPFPRIYDLLYRLFNHGPTFYLRKDQTSSVFIDT